MKRFFAFIGWILAAHLLAAQPTGLLVSEDRYQKVPLLPSYSGVKYNEVPLKVSLKKYCPVPGNQGRSSTCVGWAIGYGALTIQRAIQQGLTDQAAITQSANSAAFVYNQLRKGATDCTEGVYLEDGLNLVKLYGDCLERSFAFDRFDCAAQPLDSHFVEANLYKVQDYASVFALGEEGKSKISKACKVLATQTPIIVGMSVTKTFFEVQPGADTWNPDPSESVSGFHAMVLVGYNSVEKYVELMNSFGPAWGKNGFIRVSFANFDRHCRFAFVMLPATTPAPALLQPSKGSPTPRDAIRLAGTFAFRQPAGSVTNEQDEELVYYQEVDVRHDTTEPVLYRSVQERFSVGDVFQLVAREIPKGRYVYVFSQGPDGVVNQHFPRQNAGFMLEQTVEIVIPNEESLLQIASEGQDYLCILYSCLPIPEYERRIAELETGHMPFPQKVRRAFKDVLVQPQDIQYVPNRMSFTAVPNPEAGQIAVAMVLGVVAE